MQRLFALALGLVPASSCGDDGGGGATQTGTTTGQTTTTTTATASGSSTTTDGTGTTIGESTGGVAPSRLVVTADFRAGTLSLLDYDAIVAGADTRDAALWRTVDLSSFAPGPLEVELTPDGARAVVTVSPGFFDGPVGNLAGIGMVPGGGTLLVVDLESGMVEAELATADIPMGIAIAPDGMTAYTANFGDGSARGSTVSVIDLVGLTVIEEIVIGSGPEQVALNDDGSLGIVNAAGDGTVVVFQTADVSGTLSTPLAVSSDPSDVTFVPGTDLAVVANSATPVTYTVIDVSDPMTPTIVEEAPAPGGVPYGVTAIPGTTDVVVTTTDFTTLRYVRVGVGAVPAVESWNEAIMGIQAFPLGVAVEPADNIALSGAPGANVLVVLDLETGASRTIDWLEEPSPTYVAIQPGG